MYSRSGLLLSFYTVGGAVLPSDRRSDHKMRIHVDIKNRPLVNGRSDHHRFGGLDAAVLAAFADMVFITAVPSGISTRTAAEAEVLTLTSMTAGFILRVRMRTPSPICKETGRSYVCYHAAIEGFEKELLYHNIIWEGLI